MNTDWIDARTLRFKDIHKLPKWEFVPGLRIYYNFMRDEFQPLIYPPYSR